MLVSTLHIVYYYTVLPHPIALTEDAVRQLDFVFFFLLFRVVKLKFTQLERDLI
jgi:hypothetical protein